VKSAGIQYRPAISDHTSTKRSWKLLSASEKKLDLFRKWIV